MDNSLVAIFIASISLVISVVNIVVQRNFEKEVAEVMAKLLKPRARRKRSAN